MEDESLALDILSGPDFFFSSVEYWDQRYLREKNRDNSKLGNHSKISTGNTEWYLELDFEKRNFPFVEYVIPKPGISMRFLDIGCGNSDLGTEILKLFDGKTYAVDVTCIDFSKVVIDQMKRKYENLKNSLHCKSIDKIVEIFVIHKIQISKWM